MARRSDGKSPDADAAGLMPASGRVNKVRYRAELRALQIELARLQRHVIAEGWRVLVLLEGRDAAGKDGAIKRIVQHLSPRDTRVVAPGKPSDRELGQWYFQRFVEHLPAAGEIVLFNRSWYNRAGVERVMGFCTPIELEAFMDAVGPFESLLVRDGIRLFKYYLDIDRDEQRRRLVSRRKDPLKQWKISPVDAVALKHWKANSEARNAMLARTHHPAAPWHVVRAYDKRAARLNLIRELLMRLPYDGRQEAVTLPDPALVLPYDSLAVENGALAR
ncbi:MAG: polyphosphate kinase 2 [Alphaproteobacteria bacterium]|nr:polyphosphate kinase 2 [Alphaproteobacteria bacterium]